MKDIPESELRAALEAIARQLHRSDEKTVQRKVGRVLLAVHAAWSSSAPRLDVLEALDRAARAHLQAGIDAGEVTVELLAQGGGVRSLRRIVSVGPVEDKRWEAGLNRLLARYRSRPFTPERREQLADEFAIRIEERWPSLSYEKTRPRLMRQLRREGIKGDAEKVIVTTVRAAGVTWKHWRNPFNAASVADWRKGKE